MAVPVPLQTKSLLARAPPCSNQLNWEKGKVALDEGSAQKQQLRRGSDQTPSPSFLLHLHINLCNFRPPPSRDSPALVTTTLINFVSESSSVRFPSHLASTSGCHVSSYRRIEASSASRDTPTTAAKVRRDETEPPCRSISSRSSFPSDVRHLRHPIPCSSGIDIDMDARSFHVRGCADPHHQEPELDSRSFQGNSSCASYAATLLTHS